MSFKQGLTTQSKIMLPDGQPLQQFLVAPWQFQVAPGNRAYGVVKPLYLVNQRNQHRPTYPWLYTYIYHVTSDLPQCFHIEWSLMQHTCRASLMHCNLHVYASYCKCTRSWIWLDKTERIDGTTRNTTLVTHSLLSQQNKDCWAGPIGNLGKKCQPPSVSANAGTRDWTRDL